jgi:hypothetical protein
MNAIVKVLMERDGYTLEEATREVEYAREKVLEGENPEEILEYDFGLEPDYIFDLI